MKLTILGAGLTLILAAGVAPAPTLPDDITLLGDNEGSEGDVLSFSAFLDAEGSEPVTYTWDFGDGEGGPSGAEESAVMHRYTKDGSYTVTVRAGALEASLEVEVKPEPPVIDVLSDEPDGATVRFEAEAHDPGDDELTYVWDFGDGSQPSEGVDLTETSHRYAEAGDYTVTLTVRDEDGLEAVRVLGVAANRGFKGAFAGELQLPFDGTSGKASLSNALPGSRAIPLGNLPIFTGAAPMGGGVVDLSDAFGICLVNAGFWDDEHKAHINFQWTPNADSVFVPRMYVVGWKGAEDDRIPPDQLLVNALILGIDPSYEDTKNGAENMEIFAGGGGLSGAINTLKSMLGGLTGGGGQAAVGPGRNWQMTSYAGFIRITGITYERVMGTMDVRLRGAYMGREGSGTARYVELKGDFAWEMDENSRASMAACGGREFGIDTHTPWVEEENVDFREPDISLTLTFPYRRGTVTDQTFQVGWLGSGGGFNPVRGRLVHDDDEVTVHFVPDDELEDAVFYKARVKGGQAGIKSRSGETLSSDYEWRFSTYPDFVIEGSGGGGIPSGGDRQRQELDGPELAWSSFVGEPGTGPFAAARPGEGGIARSTESPQLVQKLCDRTDPSEWSETPTVDLLVYQSSCNQKLVPGKPAMARVYLNWAYPAGKKGIDKYTAQVRFEGAGGPAARTVTVKRQELYSDADRRDARNSVNFPFTPSGGGVQKVAASVHAYGTGSQGPIKELAGQVRTLQSMSKAVSVEIPIIFPQVGSWRDGVPRDVIDRWTGRLNIAGDGVAFAQQNYPVVSIRPKIDPKPLVLQGEPESRRTEACGPGNTRQCMNYRQYRVLTLDADDWLQSALITHYTKNGGKRPPVVLAVVPEDFGGDWGGITKHDIGLLDSFSDVRPRTPAVIFIKADMNTRTVAHEIGHALGLPHKDTRDDADRDPGIEGLRIEPSGAANKSYAEGNAAASQLISLMEAGDADKVEDNNFILNDQYHALLEHLDKNPLWVASAEGDAWFRRGDSPMDFRAQGQALGGWGPEAGQRSGPWAPPAPSEPPQAGPTLYVTGWAPLEGEGEGYLDPLVTLDAAPEPPTPGEYRLRLEGADGSVLDEVPFEPEREYWSEGEVKELTLYPFRLRLPYRDGVVAAKVVDPSGTVVAERSAGAGVPEVRFREDGGRVWRSGGAVRWQGSDPDGDALSYTLAYRPDDGADWQTVVADVPTTEATPEPGLLEPGDSPRFRLTASDGVHSATVESGKVEPALVVVERRPSGARPAPVTTVVQVRFNAPVGDGAPADALVLTGGDGAVVEGDVRAFDEGRVLELRPREPLLAGTEYAVELKDGLRSVSGARGDGERWSFTTEADTTPPAVIRTSPRQGSIAIPVGDRILIQFSEVMDESSLSAAVVVRKASGGAVAGRVAYDGTTYAAFVPDDPFEPRTAYEVRVTGAALDRSGNGLADEYTWTFTTAGEGGPLRRSGG